MQGGCGTLFVPRAFMEKKGRVAAQRLVGLAKSANPPYS
jgi:hypothetical protein